MRVERCRATRLVAIAHRKRLHLSVVASRFLNRKGRSQELDIFPSPQTCKAGIFPVRGRIEDVRVEENPVQNETRRRRAGLPAASKAMMLDSIWFEAHAFDLAAYSAIVGGIYGVI